MFKLVARVYGRDGHRQRESFGKSYTYDFSKDGMARIISVDNADKTNTNEYSQMTIIRDTEADCRSELHGQLFDGIFENSRWSKIEITDATEL